MTVSLTVSITDTVLAVLLATYTRAPDGVTASPDGAAPTPTVPVTRLVAVLITDTEF